MVSPKRIAPRAGATVRPSSASGAPRQRPASPRPRRRTTEQVVAALALVLVGGLAGAGIIGLVGRVSPSPAPSADASSVPSDDPGAGASDNPDGSVAPVSPVLEGRIPTTIDGATLTVQSAVDAMSLSASPDGRALNAAVVHLGKEATDLEIAIAFDETGSLDLTILGFRVDGIGGADMRSAVLTAWLAAGTPGVASSTLTWSGTSVTKVSYGDAGADEYVVTFDDAVFVVETADAAVAQSTVAALAGAPAASASPQASPVASPGS